MLEIADDSIPADVMLAEPLILCVVDDLRQVEAAFVLGISEKAAETRIRRARIKLAENLGDV